MPKLVLAQDVQTSVSMKAASAKPLNKEEAAAKKGAIAELRKRFEAFVSDTANRLKRNKEITDVRVGKVVVGGIVRTSVGSHCELKFKLGKELIVVEVAFNSGAAGFDLAPMRLAKFGKYRIVANCKRTAKKQNIVGSLRRADKEIRPTTVADALTAFAAAQIGKKKAVDADATKAKQAAKDAVDRFDSAVTQAKAETKAINTVVAAKVAKVVKFEFKGKPQVGVFAIGPTLSAKVSQLRFHVDGDKFQISTRKAAMIGSKYDTMSDTAFGEKKLSKANIERALKKYGYM